MKRTTVYLAEETDLAILQIAKRRGQAQAEIIRKALTAFIEREEKAASIEAIPSWLGAGDSGGVSWLGSDDERLLGLLEQEHEDVLTSWNEVQEKASS